jgi:hypothetical protein
MPREVENPDLRTVVVRENYEENGHATCEEKLDGSKLF